VSDTSRQAVLVSAPPAIAAKLSVGLTELDCAVIVLADPSGADPDGIRAMGGSLASRAEASATFSAAAAELGGFDVLVHAPALAPPPTTFAQMDEDAWVAGAEAPIWQALVLFQAAYAARRGSGGSIVALVPTIAVTGAAGLVAFASAAEGIRQLVKSAARAWGADGVRVNCVTLPIEEWGIVQERDRAVPNRYGPSLAGANSPADLAGAVALLGDPMARGLTGATLGLDRGTVLAP
jgi:NAD(P)-dependent dehydrogenase (short-subunit alcohol dehydrogenase family)